MILHAVYCNFRAEVPQAERVAIFDALADFSATLDGVLRFQHGPNRDFERKSQDYQAGFVIAFETAQALAEYAEHPTHQALGAQLCALCVGGADGIIVFDLEVPGLA